MRCRRRRGSPIQSLLQLCTNGVTLCSRIVSARENNICRNFSLDERRRVHKSTQGYGDYLFTLQAKESLIPGAGLGLFLTVSSSIHAPGFMLELPAGTLCELGIYSTSERDKNSEVELLLKNFLLTGSPRDGPRRTIHRDHWDQTVLMYTPSPHGAGVLTDEARSNPLFYANETDEIRKVATVCSQSVPNGQIHYYFCREKETDGPLRLTLGKTIDSCDSILYFTLSEATCIVMGGPTALRAGQLASEHPKH